MSFRLPADTIKAATRYLKGCSPSTTQVGKYYFEEECVLTLQQLSDLQFSALVIDDDGDEFGIALKWGKDRWIVKCSCPESPDCPHGYAAMKELIEQSEVGAPSFREEKKSVPAARGTQRHEDTKEKALSFPDIAEEKLKRSLNPKEREIALSIQKAFSDYRNADNVPFSVIRPLLCESGIFWYGGEFKERIWPTPPRDPWETWLYLAHFLKGRGSSWPAFLAKITNKAEVAALVAPWIRDQEIHAWTRRLSGLERVVDEPPPSEVVDLRLVMEPDGARLEIRTGGEEKWTLVKKPRFNELNRAGDSLELANPESAMLWGAFRRGNPSQGKLSYGSSHKAAFRELLYNPLLVDRIVSAERQPMARPPEKLEWKLTEPKSAEGDYKIVLARPDGKRLPSPLLHLEGRCTSRQILSMRRRLLPNWRAMPRTRTRFRLPRWRPREASHCSIC